eukprot:42186-Eustigmatos_ZCMA.PRE.1
MLHVHRVTQRAAHGRVQATKHRDDVRGVMHISGAAGREYVYMGQARYPQGERIPWRYLIFGAIADKQTGRAMR